MKSYAARRIVKFVVSSLFLVGFLHAQYLISSSDSLLNNGADYFIVTHENFTDSLFPLCQLRDSLGLVVRMVEANLIYATFPDTTLPASIRDCMQNVYYNWNPRPTYILLVGDADEYGGSNDYIPSPRFPKFNYHYWGGLTEHSCDNWYVTLEGNDSIPDMIIARLPVNSDEMTGHVVNKIVSYETSDSVGPWLTTVLVNSSADFESIAEQYVTDFFEPAGDSIIKIYESQGNDPSLRQRHIDAFNQGICLLMAVCHGTQPPAWHGYHHLLFDASDIQSLDHDVFPVGFTHG